jgi:hypothetical protein
MLPFSTSSDLPISLNNIWIFSHFPNVSTFQGSSRELADHPAWRPGTPRPRGPGLPSSLYRHVQGFLLLPTGRPRTFSFSNTVETSAAYSSVLAAPGFLLSRTARPHLFPSALLVSSVFLPSLYWVGPGFPLVLAGPGFFSRSGRPRTSSRSGRPRVSSRSGPGLPPTLYWQRGFRSPRACFFWFT